MEFQAQLKSFLDAVNLVSSVVPSRPTHPILANILLVAKDGKISLTGFDLITSVNKKINATIKSEGSITIPAKLTQNILSKISDSLIDVVLEDEFILIKTSQDVFKIHAIASDEYPEIQEKNTDISVELSSEMLKAIALKVIPSASNDETKQILQGINLKYIEGDDALNVASTSGHQLAWLKIPFKYVDSFEITANPQPFTLVSKMEFEGNATLSISEENFSIDAGNIKIWSRGFAGTYPNYSTLVPNKFQYAFEVNKTQMLSGIDKVSIFTDGNNKGGKFTFKDGIDITAMNNSTNNANIHVELLKTSTDCYEVGFNLGYLKNAIKAFNSDSVAIYCNDPIQPVVLKDETYTHLIMPVKLT